MDQQAIIEKLKEARALWPMGLPEQIVCSRDEKFLVSALAPRDAAESATLLNACIPAFYADEAVYAAEAQAREGESSVPIDQDPTATPALLVVFSDRSGQRDWWLCPYGISDGGALEWLEPGNLSSPDLQDVLATLDNVYSLGDCREERQNQLYLLYANDYKVVASKIALEDT